MNIKNEDYLKSMLIKNMYDLRRSAQKTSTEMKADEKAFSDFYDLATAESGRSVDLIMRSREKEMIRKIEEALTRMDHGEFGICQECGRSISEKRLRAEPTSILCIECQEREEGRLTGKHSFRLSSPMSLHSFPV
jgi:DnaK suppressor protein